MARRRRTFWGQSGLLPGLVLAIALLTSRAMAHTVGVSRGSYAWNGSELDVNLAFAADEVLRLVPEAGPSLGDLRRLEAARGKLADLFVSALEVRADGDACAGRFLTIDLDGDGLMLRGTFSCAKPARQIAARLALLGRLPGGHRHLAHLEAWGRAADDVVSSEHDWLRIGEDVRGEQSASAPRTSMFALGATHILTGYDHLLFLLALVMAGPSLRSLAISVSAFTVGHSASLALAVFGIWSPSPRLVEPAIALSIAYVGVENWAPGARGARWKITLPFGFVHGFGFAGALSVISLPREQILRALASFNAGVEVGQLAALAAVVPVLMWLRRRGVLEISGQKGLSAGIAAAGAIWFIVRMAAVI